MSSKLWLIFALLSALFAALTTALRTIVVPAMAWGMVFITIIRAVIFLHESVTLKSAIGCLRIAAGTLLMVL